MAAMISIHRYFYIYSDLRTCSVYILANSCWNKCDHFEWLMEDNENLECAEGKVWRKDKLPHLYLEFETVLWYESL